MGERVCVCGIGCVNRSEPECVSVSAQKPESCCASM